MYDFITLQNKYKEFVQGSDNVRKLHDNLIPDIKGSNEANLSLDELIALNGYQNAGSKYINILFQTNLFDILSIYEKEDRYSPYNKDTNIFTKNDIEDAINLYSAIYKIYTHRIDFEPALHESLNYKMLYRGIRSNDINLVSRVSLGFKSFTSSIDMAKNFSIYREGEEYKNGLVIKIHLPIEIPFITDEELFKYVPKSGHREEKEILFSPFSHILSYGNPFTRRCWKLEKTDMLFAEIDNNIDFDNVLYEMSIILHEYKKIKQKNDKSDKDYMTLSQLEKEYKEKSTLILNYITNRCIEIQKEIDYSRNINIGRIR